MLALLAGCGSDDGDKVQYTIEPQLDFVSVNFKAGASAPTPLDTIAITFRYRDGDSDIGLTEADRETPYDPYLFLLERDGTLIIAGSERIEAPYNGRTTSFIKIVRGPFTGKLVTLDARENPAFSNAIPPLEYPYTCLNYRAGDVLVSAEDTEILNDSHVVSDSLIIDDTKYYILAESDNVLYSRRNENTLNLYIDFLVEANDGAFSEFDFTRDLPSKICTPGFDTRLPLLAAFPPGRHATPLFTFNILSEKEGEITYAMTSSGFRDLFANKNLKLRVSVRDRALHGSNEIETTVFRVQ
jgi:hypothetical protein